MIKQLTDEQENHRLFCLRMIFKHLDLFNLWQNNNRPIDDLYALTLEVISEIKSLDKYIEIKNYKMLVNRRFACPMSALLADFNAKATHIVHLKKINDKTPRGFCFYLYFLHRSLLEILITKEQVTYVDALGLQLITNEIIEEYANFNPEIDVITYKREANKLKENFASY